MKGCRGGIEGKNKDEGVQGGPGRPGVSGGGPGGSRAGPGGVQRFWAETRKNQKNAPELYG